jgi:hypothetical protein
VPWRRELWEFSAPRVRRETDSAEAAQIVVRELRLCVSVQPGKPATSPAVAWSLGVVNQECRERLLRAMLRCVGVPARLGDDGPCQFRSATGWQDAPIPIIPQFPCIRLDNLSPFGKCPARWLTDIRCRLRCFTSARDQGARSSFMPDAACVRRKCSIERRNGSMTFLARDD